jgi:hypothetical protein
MRRPIVAIVVALVICLLAGFILVIKPVVILPAVEIHLPANNVLSNYQIGQLEVRLRTNGAIGIMADGRELGRVSYNLITLKNAVWLVARMFAPWPFLLAAIVLLAFVFPRLTLTGLFTIISLYYVLPIEITFRVISGGR